MENFYNLSVHTPAGDLLEMSGFRGKVVLVVNTATRCGFAPQFRELEQLHQKYREKGLVVLGFPCNQFQHQEPETNESMEGYCSEHFGVTFQLTEKIKVNGKDTHPIFRYLKDRLSGRLGRRIKWNFTKFLIDRDGEPFRRYAPSFKPNRIEEDIKALLDKG